MKRREMEKSHFCLFMLGMNVCVWFVLFFYLSEGVMVRGCYQGRLDEVWEMVYQSGVEIGKSVATVRHYQNDDAEPKIGDMVTAIEFVGDDEVLFYKAEIHEQLLIDERVRINRKVTNVFMGVFCGVFAVMYLICRAEEKSRRDVIVVDARGD